MHWRQFVMDLDSLDPATVEEVFSRLGAFSVTLSDAGDDPVLEPGPGETPLWSSTRVTGLFSDDTDMDWIRNALARELAVDRLPAHRVEVLADRAWELEWLKDFGPMRFGKRLWVCPTDRQVDADNAVVVYLDPGLAFGTGTHPTTAMCLEWLDGIDLHGKSLLDYGCGSGVLAIAALKLGCRSAAGLDIDPQATVAAQRNGEDNGVGDNLVVTANPDSLEGPYDVVVANILAGPLVQFADSITSLVTRGGMLALSGVLCEQADEVAAAYEAWIEFDNPEFREQDGQAWSRLTGRKR